MWTNFDVLEMDSWYDWITSRSLLEVLDHPCTKQFLFDISWKNKGCVSLSVSCSLSNALEQYTSVCCNGALIIITGKTYVFPTTACQNGCCEIKLIWHDCCCTAGLSAAEPILILSRPLVNKENALHKYNIKTVVK